MKKRETLDEDFLNNEVRLSDQLSKRNKADKNSEEYEQNRILFFYELCRELCHWIGTEELDFPFIRKFYAKQEFSDIEYWAFLYIVHGELKDEPYNFQPWKCLTKDAKVKFTSTYAEQAKTSSHWARPRYRSLR